MGFTPILVHMNAVPISFPLSHVLLCPSYANVPTLNRLLQYSWVAGSKTKKDYILLSSLGHSYWQRKGLGSGYQRAGRWHIVILSHFNLKGRVQGCVWALLENLRIRTSSLVVPQLISQHFCLFLSIFTFISLQWNCWVGQKLQIPSLSRAKGEKRFNSDILRPIPRSKASSSSSEVSLCCKRTP